MEEGKRQIRITALEKVKDEYMDLLGDNLPPKVDALKKNGKTVYPTNLYLRGEWTWNTFEEYLEKIDKHFMNVPSSQRKEQRIEAYWTDYRDTALQVLHSAGTSIYGASGLKIATDRMKKAVVFWYG